MKEMIRGDSFGSQSPTIFCLRRGRDYSTSVPRAFPSPSYYGCFPTFRGLAEKISKDKACKSITLVDRDDRVRIFLGDWLLSNFFYSTIHERKRIREARLAIARNPLPSLPRQDDASDDVKLIDSKVVPPQANWHGHTSYILRRCTRSTRSIIVFSPSPG